MPVQLCALATDSSALFDSDLNCPEEGGARAQCSNLHGLKVMSVRNNLKRWLVSIRIPGMGTTAACRAVFGKGLGADLRGMGGQKSVGGKKANLTGNVLAYATEIGECCVLSAVLERRLLCR